MSEHERRVHPRYELLAQVGVRAGSIDHVLAVVNLSRGGALIDLGSEPRPEGLELHRSVDLCLLDADGHALLETRGDVVRIAETLDHRTFAVRFEALLDDDVVRGVLSTAGRPPPLPGPARSEG